MPEPKPQRARRSKEAGLAELKRVLLAERAERLRQAGVEDRPAVPPGKPKPDRTG